MKIHMETQNQTLNLRTSIIKISFKSPTDMCILSNNIYDYVNVSQGKITIPNVDDGEECTLTDVSPLFSESPNLC